MGQLQQFYGQDKFIYHEFYEGIDHPVYCKFCCEVISGPAYVVNREFLSHSFHKSCAELPCEIQHPLHPQHPVIAFYVIRERKKSAYGGFICDGCEHYSWGVRYCCEMCDLNFDVRCVSKHESQQLALKERIEIPTPFHKHRLQRFYYNMLLSTPSLRDIICCCCLKGFQGSAYACCKCRLLIHESCIDQIPQQVKSPFHLEHPLLLRHAFTGNSMYYECHACVKRVKGLMLSCEQCGRNFHIGCCTHTTSGLRLKKYHEKHPMVYVNRRDKNSLRMKCVVCNTTCDKCASYCCLDCEVFIHMECIPLPCVVKHECHPYHALTLSYSTHVLKIASNEYRCVVCEEVGDPILPFYYCEECPDIAHIDCVLSEEDPPSEILEYLVPRKKFEEDPPSDILEYLVPMEKSKSEKETYDYESEQDDKTKQQNNIDNKDDKSALGKDKVQESEEQKEGKSELEEIDKNIADFKKKMDKVAKEREVLDKELEVLAAELEVLQEIHAQKLNSQHHE